MSEVFQSEMVINSSQFNSMMQEDDMKKYFKEKLAIELARKLIETNRATFSYTKLYGDRDAIRLSARVKL
jgi:hypothetical protein